MSDRWVTLTVEAVLFWLLVCAFIPIILAECRGHGILNYHNDEPKPYDWEESGL